MTKFLWISVLVVSSLAARPVLGETPTESPSQPVAAEAPTEEREPMFRFGPYIGYGSSTFACSGCTSAGVEPRYGLAAGITMEILLASWMALEMEAMYLQKGAKIENFGTNDQYINYHTIEFPLSFKGRFGSEKVKGVVFGGPQFGIAVKRTFTNTAGTTSDLPMESTDIGMHLGGGIEVRVSPHVFLFANGRLNIGLKSLKISTLGNSGSSVGALTTYGAKFGF